METLSDIIKKKDNIIKRFNLTEEDFKHILYWYKNKLSSNNTNLDNPTLALKNPDKSYKGCTTGLDDDKGNTTWVTNRFASALEYARSHGKKKSSK